MLSYSLHAALSVKKHFVHPGTCLKDLQSRRVKPWAVPTSFLWLPVNPPSCALPNTVLFQADPAHSVRDVPTMTARKGLLQDVGHGRSTRWHFIPNESLSHSFFLSEEEITAAHSHLYLLNDARDTSQGRVLPELPVYFEPTYL